MTEPNPIEKQQGGTIDSHEKAESFVTVHAGCARRSPFDWLKRARWLHFALLGSSLFAALPKTDDPRRIELGKEEMAGLFSLHTRREGQVLGPEQKREILTRHVEDEIMYREGLLQHLDEGDSIVRQRVIHKMMFYAEDLAGASSPATTERLRAYYLAHREHFAGSFEDEQKNVQLLYSSERKHAAVSELVERLFREYEVSVQIPSGEGVVKPSRGTGRVAPRGGE